MLLQIRPPGLPGVPAGAIVQAFRDGSWYFRLSARPGLIYPSSAADPAEDDAVPTWPPTAPEAAPYAVPAPPPVPPKIKAIHGAAVAAVADALERVNVASGIIPRGDLDSLRPAGDALTRASQSLRLADLTGSMDALCAALDDAAVAVGIAARAVALPVHGQGAQRIGDAARDAATARYLDLARAAVRA